MSAHVKQVVLHPGVTGALKVGSTTVGRDKLYRTVQYMARFLSWYGARNGFSKEVIAQLNALKGTLALSRKLMRIGKPVEHAQAAIKALDSAADPVLKATAFGRQVGYGGYLFFDMLVWLNSTKAWPVAPARAKSWNERGARLWFTGIAFSIVSGLYQLRGLAAKKKAALRSAGEKDDGNKAALKALSSQEKAVQFQLIQDALDILIPSHTLGWHKLDEGVVGIAGTITSLMGLRTQMDKVLGK